MDEAATPTGRHPFGTMKWMMGHPRFLVRGLIKQRRNWRSACSATISNGSINILGVQQLLLALRTAPA